LSEVPLYMLAWRWINLTRVGFAVLTFSVADEYERRQPIWFCFFGDS